MSRNALVPVRQPQPEVRAAGEEQARLYAHLAQSRRAAEVLRVVQEAEQADAASVPLGEVVAGLASGDA